MQAVDSDRSKDIFSQSPSFFLEAMKHDNPNRVFVAYDKTTELIWKFSKASNLEFACNLPGHYQEGVVSYFRNKG